MTIKQSDLIGVINYVIRRHSMARNRFGLSIPIFSANSLTRDLKITCNSKTFLQYNRSHQVIPKLQEDYRLVDAEICDGS